MEKKEYQNKLKRAQLKCIEGEALIDAYKLSNDPKVKGTLLEAIADLTAPP